MHLSLRGSLALSGWFRCRRRGLKVCFIERVTKSEQPPSLFRFHPSGPQVHIASPQTANLLPALDPSLFPLACRNIFQLH